MQASIKTAGIIIATGILFGLALSPAHAADSTDTVNATISGGNLSANPTAPSAMTPVVLDGVHAQSSTGTAAWTITNARGTSTAWSLSASVVDFKSAAGSVDGDVRTLAATNLVITPGTITAGAGSDAAPTAAAVTMSNAGQTLVRSTTLGKGTFTLTPTFSLTVPANTFRSNFSGAIGDSPLNPYVSTITFTIA
ncbi:hypothetical protein SAMN05216368_106110 [Cryobacterium flavum]|uniref:WxL domain-containing protein n=1 Tax=Cryobacterium flavum TaxID=1424659 RepID=A0A4R8VFA4_9MICO|nr:hypothetical protein [Cryobacterium flavum]TFB81623.1 hypothetical protein E3O21_02080 [Cryobacterium flavum]SDN59453.1 hypothetical protein SAMN05216368_106110 [Cryobacterium flavum]